MTPTALVEISDVADKPLVKMDLPSTLRLGDRLKLRFKLQRQHGGRSEVLEVSGDYRVSNVWVDTSEGSGRQHLSVEAVGKAASWVAVKKRAEPSRKLALAVSPRTPIGGAL